MPAAVRRVDLARLDYWKNRIAVLRFVQDIPLSPGHPSYKTLVAVEESLAQFRQHPMLLVWGMQDWCFTSAFLREFESRFPQAETLELPDAGHYVFEDAYETMIPRIRTFFKAHPLANPSQATK